MTFRRQMSSMIISIILFYTCAMEVTVPVLRAKSFVIDIGEVSRKMNANVNSLEIG